MAVSFLLVILSDWTLSLQYFALITAVSITVGVKIILNIIYFKCVFLSLILLIYVLFKQEINHLVLRFELRTSGT